MNRKRTNGWTLVPLALAIACGALALVWPHWRSELRAQSTYRELDPFLCYKTKRVKQLISVGLCDWFDCTDDSYYEGKVSTVFCAPADVIGDVSPIQDPDTHIMVYKIKGPHERRSEVEVANIFGVFLYDTKKTDSLMVPSAKSIYPEPPPGQPDPESEVDHYRCLKVKVSKGESRLPKGMGVDVNDQFGSRMVFVKRPFKLCLATSKNGEDVKNPHVHLMCYKVKPEPKTSATGVQVNNQISPASLILKKEHELCVPSTIAYGYARGLRAADRGVAAAKWIRRRKGE